MNQKLSRIAALGSIVAIGALGAPAMATPPAGSPSASHKPATPGPTASAKAKANAYGKYCAAFSKKHIAGQKRHSASARPPWRRPPRPARR